MIKKIGCLLFLLFAFSMQSSAYAQKITVETSFIKASNKGDVIDSRLRKIASQLVRLNYPSYSLIGRGKKTGRPREELLFDMPDGDTLRIVVIGIEDTYIKLLVSMKNAGLKTNFKINNNGTVIVGGNEYQDGSLIIALTASY